MDYDFSRTEGEHVLECLEDGSDAPQWDELKKYIKVKLGMIKPTRAWGRQTQGRSD